MTAIFAQGGFLTDVSAVITAVTSLIAGLFAVWKYFDERQKRLKAEIRQKNAEQREQQAEDRERKVEARNTELENAIVTLQRTLSDMQSLHSGSGETVDERVLASIQQLAERVNQLTSVVNQLQRDVDELRQSGSGGNKQPTPLPQPESVNGNFEVLRRQLEQAIASRRLSPDRRDRVIWNGPQGRIPVVIIRRGAQNHRVLFPDGTDDKVAVSELFPM